MRKIPVKVKIGQGNASNIEILNKYLNIILPGWIRTETDNAQIYLGTMPAISASESLLVYNTSIDDAFVNESEKISLGNKLKLVAATLWLKEGDSNGKE